MAEIKERADARVAQFPSSALADAPSVREGVRQMHRDIGRILQPAGIDEGRFVELGGFPQWISIRGQNRSAPVLLFLHGGPLNPISEVAYMYQRPWEDFFVVVNWDQRGCGRSIGTPADDSRLKGTLNRAQYRSDAIALIEHLRATFGQQRIILVGQSWGTVLALEVARERPELLHIAVLQGLAVEWVKSVERVRHTLIEWAIRDGDTKEAERLTALGPPTPNAPEDTLVWAQSFGRPIPDRNTWHNIDGPGDSWTRRIDMLRYVSPDLPADVYEQDANRMLNELPRMKARYDEAMGSAIPWNARRDVGTAFNIPIAVMMGAHDWQTSIDLAREYYEEIRAPWKSWTEFPRAAHALNIEQPGLSVVSLVKVALAAIEGRIPEGAIAAGSKGNS